MTITTLAMVATAFVGNLYEIKDRPVPGWAQTALLYYAARCLGYCTRCVDTPVSTTYSSLAEPDDADTGGGGDATARTAAAASVENGGYNQPRRQWTREPSYRLVTLLENPDCSPRIQAAFPTRSTGEPPPPSSTSTTTATPVSSGDLTATVGRRQAMIPSSGNAADVQTATAMCFAKDWINVAAVCDRLFFWLCFVLTVVTTVILFYPLTWQQGVGVTAIAGSFL